MNSGYLSELRLFPMYRLNGKKSAYLAYFLTLPLPTETTAEGINVPTDRHHPLNTYDDHNRFRQLGFAQQIIIVDIDDVE